MRELHFTATNLVEDADQAHSFLSIEAILNQLIEDEQIPRQKVIRALFLVGILVEFQKTGNPRESRKSFEAIMRKLVLLCEPESQAARVIALFPGQID